MANINFLLLQYMVLFHAPLTSVGVLDTNSALSN